VSKQKALEIPGILEVYELTCNACSAPLPVSSHNDVGKCEYCRTPFVVVDRYAGPEIPDVMLPSRYEANNFSTSTVISTSSGSSGGAILEELYYTSAPLINTNTEIVFR
jgi:hypothetical protein